MSKQNRSTIKTYFETGDVPTQTQFSDSFDSQVFWNDDVVTTVDGSSTDDDIPTAKAVYDAIGTATPTTYEQITLTDFQTAQGANALVVGKWYLVLDAVTHPVYDKMNLLVQAVTDASFDTLRVYGIESTVVYLQSYLFGFTDISFSSYTITGGWLNLTDALAIAYSGGIAANIPIIINSTYITHIGDDGTYIQLVNVQKNDTGIFGTYDPNTSTFTPNASGGVASVNGTTVDNTDPLNPIVNVPTLEQVNDGSGYANNTSKWGVDASDNTQISNGQIIKNNGSNSVIIQLPTPTGNGTILLKDPINNSETLAFVSDIPSGDVVGPSSAIDANIAVFDNTTGKLIKDGGKTIEQLVTANGTITGATKTKITYDSKGLVTAGVDLVASDIPTIAQSQVSNLVTDLAAKADKVSITGATKTKVTYNAQGIVTAGADATTADIADSTNKRYVTDAQLATLGTLISGTAVVNFGNENDSATLTIANATITNAGLKNFSILPTETSATSLDDFAINNVSFAIENIIDNVSFDIRGIAGNNASGNYTVKYLITT